MSPPSNSSSAVAGLSIAAAAALAGFTFAVAAARSGWLPEELLPSSRRRGKRSPKFALGPGITPAVAVKAAVSDSDSDDDDEEIDGAAARSLTATPRSNGNGYGNGATTSSPPVPAQLLFDENDEVVKEQLTRNRQFFGAGGQRQLAASLVVVVGLGGVGSHAAAALLRAGVGRLRLVDFDQVSLSSLNRHAVAERKDVGIPKATCLKRHFRRIMPEVQVDARVAMFDSQTADSVLGPDPSDGKRVDFVIDAIDNVPTKVELLRRCVVGGVPAITVTGAGAKADPTRLRVTSLGGSGSSRGDKLAKSVRHKLGRALREMEMEKKGEGEEGGREGGGGGLGGGGGGRSLEAAAAALPAVISDESPWCGLVDVGEDEKEDPSASIAALRSRVGDGHPLIAAAMEEFRAVPGFRVRALPVLGPTPAAAGLAAAAFVLCHLAGRPLLPAPPEPRSAPHYQVLLDRLVEREEALAGEERGRRSYGGGEGGGEKAARAALVTADVDDVAFLVREVWRGVSAVELCSQDPSSSSSSRMPSVPGGECGLATATSRLTLCRWRQQQQQQEQEEGGSPSSSPPPPASVDNLVLLTFAEAELHERGELVSKLDARVVERIERALERVRREFCGPTEMTA